VARISPTRKPSAESMLQYNKGKTMKKKSSVPSWLKNRMGAINQSPSPCRAIIKATPLSIQVCIQSSSRVFNAVQLTNLRPSLYTQQMEKSSRWWDLPSAVLLFVAVLFSAWRLQTTDWTEGLGHVRNVAILGLLVGLALGQSRFQKRGVILLSIGYMLVFFLWQWLGLIPFEEEQTYLGDRLLILFGR